MPGELREELEAAFKELSSEENTEQTSSVDQPPAEEQPAEEQPSAPAPRQSAERDASGKFAPRTPAKNEVPQDQQPPAQEGVTPPAAPVPHAPPPGRAPISWTPEERQGWENIPAHHQAAIMRREREIDATLRQTAADRKFAQEVNQVIQPYMGMIEAEGGTPVTAIRDVMRTAAALRTSPPTQKAQLVADLVLNFGIDPQMLDQVLVHRLQGRPMPQDPMFPVMQQLDERLKPITEFMNSLQQQRQTALQRTQAEVEQTLEQFLGDPNNEFARDVAGDMADILELAAKRGQVMSLQDAYSRATMLHPSISKIIEGRRNAQGAAQQTAAARRARNAAVSVGGDGAPSGSSEDESDSDDIRSALGAAIKQHSGRR